MTGDGHSRDDDPTRPIQGSEDAETRPIDDPDDTVAFAQAAAAPAAGGPDLIGRAVGRYTIRGVIASGGMGTVYEAVQEQPHRTVALKLIRNGVASAEALRRFEYEAEVLARLSHPGIAQIYEAGTHGDGDEAIPYFAMEYIEDASEIVEYTRDQGLARAGQLDLFARACDAVQHGHQRGIIHRDLKPSNILIDARGNPRIIDFGIARATEGDLAQATAQTAEGQIVGTLQYMSPEQCLADPDAIDTRTDVYALGVILYELLCGRVPHDLTQTPVVQALMIVLEEPPPKPSGLDRSLRGDLETIVLKALDKDVERRYASAAALAADVRHFLANEPITARPPTLRYQLTSFARRNRTLVAGAAAVLIALLVGIGTTTWQWSRARAAANEAAAVSAFLGGILPSHVSMDPSRSLVEVYTAETLVSELLDDAVEAVPGTFAGQPHLQADVLLTLSGAYWGIGLFVPAEQLARDALAIREELYGGGDLRTLEAKVVLAEALRNQMRSEEAEPLFQEALEVYTAHPDLGERHPRTLSVMSSIVFTLSAQPDRAAECGELGMRALELEREVLGEGAFMTRLTMATLAEMLVHAGRFDQAEEMAQTVIEASRAVGDGDGYCVWWASSTLGQIKSQQGEFREAERLLREAHAGLQGVWGEGHPFTIPPLGALIMQLLGEGRFADAEPLCVQAVEVCRGVYGEGHDYTLWAEAMLEQARAGMEGD